MVQSLFSLVQSLFKTKINVDEVIELTWIHSDIRNFLIYLKSSATIEDLHEICRRKYLESVNQEEVNNFEPNLFYKHLDHGIKIQLKIDEDLNDMFLHHQKRNAMNRIMIFTEDFNERWDAAKRHPNARCKIIGGNHHEKIQWQQGIMADLQQIQSTSTGNLDILPNFSKSVFEDLKVLKMDDDYRNEKRKNNFSKIMDYFLQNNASLDYKNVQIHGNKFDEFAIRFGHFKVDSVCLLHFNYGDSRILFNLDVQMENWLVAGTINAAENDIFYIKMKENYIKEKNKLLSDNVWIDKKPITLYSFHNINFNGEIMCTKYQLKNTEPIIVEKFFEEKLTSEMWVRYLLGNDNDVKTDQEENLAINDKIDQRYLKFKKKMNQINRLFASFTHPDHVCLNNYQSALVHFDGLSAKQLLTSKVVLIQGTVWLYENCYGDEKDFLDYFRHRTLWMKSLIVIEMVGIGKIKSNFNWLPDVFLFQYCKLVILKADLANDFDRSPKITIWTISNFLTSKTFKCPRDFECIVDMKSRIQGSLQNDDFIKYIPSFHASRESVASDLFNQLTRDLFLIPGRVLCIDLKLLIHPEFGISKYAEPLHLVFILFKDFINAAKKHPYLLFLKCPSTTVLPDFSLKCQNKLGETFEMKQFVDDAGKRKVERKILWIERYFLETTKYCLKNSSCLHQNAKIVNIINGNNNNVTQCNINTKNNVGFE